MNYYKAEKAEGYFIVTGIILCAMYQGLYFPIQYCLGNLIITLVALYLFIKNRGVAFNRKPLFFLCFFIFIYLLSALISDNKIIAFEETIRVLGFIPVLFIGIYLDKALYKYFLKSIIISAIIVSLIGIASLAEMINIKGSVYNGRLQSTLSYANTTALFILIGILTSLKVFVKKGYTFYINLFILIFALISTYSRSVWVIFVIVTIYLLFFNKIMSKTEKFKYVNIILITIGLLSIREKFTTVSYIYFIISGVFVTYLIYRIEKQQYIFYIIIAGLITLLNNNQGLIKRILNVNIDAGELNARLAYYKGALKVIMQNPLFGCGVRGWELICSDVVGIYSKYVHNYYLQIACDAGLLALISFGGFVYLVIKKHKGSFITLLIIVVILLHSAIDVSMHFQLISYIFFIFCGRFIKN